MSKREGKIIEIQNAAQYRVIETQKQYFLIDIDNNILGTVFFPLNWLVSQRGYVLSEADYQRLLTNQKNSQIGKVFIALFAAVGAIWGRFSTIQLEVTQTYPTFLKFLVLAIVIGLSIILRHLICQLRGRRVRKLIDLNDRQSVHLYIRPRVINLQMISFLFLYFLFLMLIFLTILLFFRYNNPILVFFLLLFILSLSFTSAASFREGAYMVVFEE